MKTVNEVIIEYLTGKDYCWGGKIEDYVRARVGSKASCCARRLRELAQDGILETDRRKINNKGPDFVLYRIRVLQPALLTV